MNSIRARHTTFSGYTCNKMTTVATAKVYAAVESINFNVLSDAARQLPSVCEAQVRYAAYFASTDANLNLGTFLRCLQHFIIHLQRYISTGITDAQLEHVLDDIYGLSTMPNITCQLKLVNAPDTYHVWLDTIILEMVEFANGAGYTLYALIITIALPHALKMATRTLQ